MRNIGYQLFQEEMAAQQPVTTTGRALQARLGLIYNHNIRLTSSCQVYKRGYRQVAGSPEAAFAQDGLAGGEVARAHEHRFGDALDGRGRRRCGRPRRRQPQREPARQLLQILLRPLLHRADNAAHNFLESLGHGKASSIMGLNIIVMWGTDG